MLFWSCEKNHGDTRSCKVMFLFNLGGKYFKIRTCKVEFSSGFITIMNEYHTVMSQISKPWFQFSFSMFNPELPRINSCYY
jgi:hypothetical protein